MIAKANEWTFQNDMLKHLVANGWLLGKPENYNRELALYPEDVLGFVKDTQDEQWQKFCALYPANPEQKFLERVIMKERRTALISAAVTGKIDVRHWDAPKAIQTNREVVI
jgi:type I restriction enzyme R subunit